MTTPPEPVNAPIRITYRESADFLLDAMEHVPREKIRVSFGTIAAMVAIVLLLLFQYALQPTTRRLVVLIVTITLMLAGAGGFWFLLRCLSGKGDLGRKWIRRQYRAQTGRDETQVVCEFGDAGLFRSAEGGAASQHPWTATARVVETPKGLVLYQTKELFHWFPKTAFASPAQYDAVVRLIHSKVASFERSS